MIEPGMMRTDFLDASSARHGDVEITDYADAVAQFRSFIEGANHTQPGDPAELAARLVELAASPSVPARLLFGDDALQWTSEKLDRLGKEVKSSADLTARSKQIWSFDLVPLTGEGSDGNAVTI